MPRASACWASSAISRATSSPTASRTTPRRSLGTPEEIIARLKELEAGGATNILLVDPNASVRNLQAFAREVMPSFQTSRYAAAE